MNPHRLVFLLLPGLCTFAQSQSATMTVPGLGRVLAGSGVRQTLNCGADAVTINGNNNRVTLGGRCPRVTVNGSRNVVEVATAGQLVANGNGNTLNWQRAMNGSVPTQRLIGSGNRVSKVSRR